jgi:uncharacterized protein YdeI (YjbR/CyaY-like superfamily)
MELYLKTRKEWRNWLEKNHAFSDGVWLIFYKKATGKPRVEYNDAVEEALCFGWIDSKLKKVNEEYHIQHFTPRRKGSLWSKYNVNRVKKLIEEGLMMPAGLAEYQKAIDNPRLIYDNKNDGDPEIPEDLLKALFINPEAHANFNNFSPSNRRTYIFWLNSAKRGETRQNRIAKIVEFSEKNRKPGML